MRTTGVEEEEKMIQYERQVQGIASEGGCDLKDTDSKESATAGQTKPRQKKRPRQ